MPTKEEAEKAVDEMFRQRLSRHHVFYANKTLRADTWREIAISLYMRPSTPVAAQESNKCRCCNVAIQSYDGWCHFCFFSRLKDSKHQCTPVAAQDQPAENTSASSGYLQALDMKRSAEAAQGGTQETTKEQRLIDLENELKYANAALGGNPAIQLCDRIRILKAGVAASQDTTKEKS